MAKITAPPSPAKKMLSTTQAKIPPITQPVVVAPPTVVDEAEYDPTVVYAEVEEEEAEQEVEQEEEEKFDGPKQSEVPKTTAPVKTRVVAGQAELAEREILMIANISTRLMDRVNLWRPGSNPDHKTIISDLKVVLGALQSNLKAAETDFHTLMDTGYQPVKQKVKGALEVGARVEFAGSYAEAYAEILTAAELDGLFVSKITETGKFVISTSDPETGDDRVVGVISNNGIKVR